MEVHQAKEYFFRHLPWVSLDYLSPRKLIKLSLQRRTLQSLIFTFKQMAMVDVRAVCIATESYLDCKSKFLTMIVLQKQACRATRQESGSSDNALLKSIFYFTLCYRCCVHSMSRQKTLVLKQSFLKSNNNNQKKKKRQPNPSSTMGQPVSNTEHHH